MKIAIDAYRLVSETNTSGALYIQELALSLATDPRISKVILLTPIPPSSINTKIFDATGRIRFKFNSNNNLQPSSTWLSNTFWIQHTVRHLIAECINDGGVDWFIAPYHQVPVLADRRVRILTIVHDLCGLRANCGYKIVGKGYWRHWFNFVTARLRADRFVPISHYTRSEFIRRYPLTESQMSQPITNSVSTVRLQPEIVDTLLAEQNLNRYTYCIGFAAPGPRKGTDITLQAYRDYRAAGGHLELSLIGSADGIKEWRAYAESIGVSGIRWLSGISDSSRDALYSGAACLLFPSRCEGFGYPIVEAMRQGCPVVAWKDTPAEEILAGTMPLMTELNAGEVVSLLFHYENLALELRSILNENIYQQSLKFRSESFGEHFVNNLVRA